jgi:hypothetical protein
LRQAMKHDNMRLSTDVTDIAVTWAFPAHLHVDGVNAPVADLVSILAATELDVAGQIVTESITSPKVPRNVQVVGNTAGMVGNVTVRGTAYDGKSISEVIALNGTTVVAGNLAFMTVTEIDLPVQTGAGDTVSVGVGDKLGLPYKLTFVNLINAYLNKVKEGTAPTFTSDPENIEHNTITLNSPLNGEDVDVFLIV